jgi:hypothetical protein
LLSFLVINVGGLIVMVSVARAGGDGHHSREGREGQENLEKPSKRPH